MEIERIINKLIDLIKNKKGINIISINLKSVTTIADYFIIASGNSKVHLKAMAKEIAFLMKKTYSLQQVNHPQSFDNKWILMDYGDFMVHLFYEDVREFYNLEGLWADAKIREIK